MSAPSDDSLDDLLRAIDRAGVDTSRQLVHLARTLDDSPNVCYIVDDRFRFVHCNLAWDRFAAENGGRGLEREKMIGADLFLSIPPVLTDAYRQAFASVDAGGRVWVKAYECSSPEVFRKFQMRIHPLQHPRGFLVTNALLLERPHEHTAGAAPAVYVKDGIVTMCAHCRCSRRSGAPEQWDFVPEHLEFKGVDAQHVSHGLCPICLAYFYPDVAP